jgi:LPXTG-site transpeptidase (sortase) family protein
MDPSEPHIPSRTTGIVALAAGAAIVAGALIFLVAATPASVGSFAMQRVTVEADVAPPEAVAQGCPELTNPGGQVDWSPDPDAAPVATNGRVQLPSLGVEAPIVKVGIDSSERMVVPTNARDIAWLDQGGFPGRTRNVVLAGHIAYNRAAGSFNRIKDLQPGDEVTIAIDEKVLRYRVVWNCSFSRDTTLADRIMGYTTRPSVTLISCGGVFDTAARTHTNRIVVRAEQITDSGEPVRPAISTA